MCTWRIRGRKKYGQAMANGKKLLPRAVRKAWSTFKLTKFCTMSPDFPSAFQLFAQTIALVQQNNGSLLSYNERVEAKRQRKRHPEEEGESPSPQKRARRSE